MNLRTSFIAISGLVSYMAAIQRDPSKTTKETIDNETYRIRVYDEIEHTDYDARIEIERNSDRETWQFHIDEHGIAHYYSTTAVDDLLATPTIPSWVELVCYEIGIETIEAE